MLLWNWEKKLLHSHGNGSWSNVYEYNGKFYSFDEVNMVEFDSPQDAFKRANIGRNDFDEIDSQYIDSKYKHLV